MIFFNNQNGNIARNIDKEEKLYFYYNNGCNLRFPTEKDIGFNIKNNYLNSEFTWYRNLIDTLMVSENIEFLKRATEES